MSSSYCVRPTSSVLRLHDDGTSCPPRCNRLITGISQCDLVVENSSLRSNATMVVKNERAFGRASFDERHCEVSQARSVTVLRGKGYIVNVPMSKRKNFRIQALDTAPFWKKLDQCSPKSSGDTDVQPMFLVEGTDEEELKGIELQLTIFKKNNFNLKYFILQQDIPSLVWRDITHMSKIGKGFCPEIRIPVQNSARIWVVPFNRRQCNLQMILDQLNARLSFHVLSYLYLQQAKIKVRLVGMREDLYRSRDACLPPAGKIAGDQTVWKRGPESGPVKTLSRNLKVEFYRDGTCFKSSMFDIEKANEDQFTDECLFDVKDLCATMKAKVVDDNGNCVWSLGLNEIPLLARLKICAMPDDLPWPAAEDRKPLIIEPTYDESKEKVEEKLELRSFKRSGENLEGSQRKRSTRL
ncbi:uncharacterized protein LOC114520318 [Dendronephthya gigantea]|uniref:uncharacterized protein LOC114520318 n=1 Tax=Dendronephthya gigantea TaxID=151771 RepID=UPI00106A3632|nr:uncharacterized protein LOC114520318 [Dendronephthya gigantea]